jgi:4-amino-4-deoxy-L-arabinose transferase-like glycosyltransferase
MTPFSKMRPNVTAALLAGLALRLFFVLKFPATDSGDAPFYIELAWNWLKKGVYGFPISGHLTPVDVRMPGYPAFLAAIFEFAGNSQRAVMFVQVVVDLATCFLIALIAARLAPSQARRRVALAGLWLAALCPFTANYAAVVLTETPVTFLTALAVLILMGVLLDKDREETPDSARRRAISPWFLGGVVAGFGTLFRPETPLLLVALGLVLLAQWFRPRAWKKLARSAALMAAGLLLPLLPWAARNWRALHEVRFLAPRYSELPGESTPLGFSAWTRTWLWRFGDVYTTLWKIDDQEISMADLPRSAFDSPQERARVASALARYNETFSITRGEDDEFGEIARERTARHPLRTYLKIPLLRSLAIWFTPRVDLLPYSGHPFPLGEEWEYDREDFLATLSLFFVNCAYVALGVAGAWIARGRPGWALLIAFIVVRTAFIATYVDTPEPRYVLECFPAIIALAAQVFSGTA